MSTLHRSRYSWLSSVLPALALLLSTTVISVAGTAAPAAAVTAPTVTLTSIDPPIDVLHPSTGTTIEVRNPTKPIEFLDLNNQPWLRINQDGVFERGENGTFAQVRKETFYYISDGDIARQITDRSSLPYPWRMAGTYGGQPFVMTGTIIPAGMKLPDPGAPASAGESLPWGVLLRVAAVLLVGAIFWFRRRPVGKS